MSFTVGKRICGKVVSVILLKGSHVAIALGFPSLIPDMGSTPFSTDIWWFR